MVSFQIKDKVIKRSSKQEGYKVVIQLSGKGPGSLFLIALSEPRETNAKFLDGTKSSQDTSC